MCLTALRPLPVALFLLLACGAPADASGTVRVSCSRSPAQTQARIDLYSPRVRRATASYLRLRLLELREAGLDRARAAIERRLTIDELLAEPTGPNRADDGGGRGVPMRPCPVQKAPGAQRRTDGP